MWYVLVLLAGIAIGVLPFTVFKKKIKSEEAVLAAKAAAEAQKLQEAAKKI